MSVGVRATIGGRWVATACWVAGLAWLWMSPASAWARMSMSVTPSALEFEAQPGQSVVRYLYVLNGGQGALSLTTQLSDWRVDQSDKRIELPAGVDSNSVSQWVTVTPESLVVQPGGQGVFRVAVQPPDSEREGVSGTLDVIMSSKPLKGPVNTAVGGSIAVQLLIHKRGTPPRLELRIGSIRPPTSQRKLQASLLVKNAGDAPVRAEATLDILGPLDDFVAFAAEPKPGTLLLPGETREVSLEWDGSLGPGSHTAIATAFCGGDEVAVDQVAFDVGSAEPAMPTVVNTIEGGEPLPQLPSLAPSPSAGAESLGASAPVKVGGKKVKQGKTTPRPSGKGKPKKGKSP